MEELRGKGKNRASEMNSTSEFSFPFVRLEKIALSEREPSDRRSSSNVGSILASGYLLEGWLLAPIVCGGRIHILRVNRNGIRRLGIFVSSPVVQIVGELIWTQNSQYLCEIGVRSDCDEAVDLVVTLAQDGD